MIFISMSSNVHFYNICYSLFVCQKVGAKNAMFVLCACSSRRTQCEAFLYIKSAWKPLHIFLGLWLRLRNIYTLTILLGYQLLFTVHQRRCFKNIYRCSQRYNSKFAYLQLLLVPTIQAVAQLRWLWHHRYNFFHLSYGSNILRVDDRAIISSCLDSV